MNRERTKNGESARTEARSGGEAKKARPYDVVVWGASGFTGQLVAEYLARRYGIGRSLKWALAGRDHDKLRRVRDALVAVDPRARDLPILVGDGRERASLAPIVSSTRVVATTVGPYAVHGHELVAACVEHGTDSCDLTGEPQFVRAIIERHHARARETGARIVNCCGFDSIPSDLGVLLLQNEMAARRGMPCEEVKYFVVKMRGGFSGGTAASALHVAEEMSQDPSVRSILANPYSLDPDRAERGPDGPDQRGVRWDPDLECWTGPFMMAAINTRIVRRTNALLEYRYGKDFRYSECQAFSRGMSGFLKATALSAGFAAFMVSAALGPLRTILASALPSPGQGPSKAERDAGFFVVKLIGVGSRTRGLEPLRLVATICGQSDPGYGETAKMLSESAVSLAADDLPTEGGILTPASCMGMHLVERLRRAGMAFDVETLTNGMR